MRLLSSLLLIGVLLPLMIDPQANAGSTGIVINEVFVDPASLCDGAEFVEIHNPTGSTVDLGGWTLTGADSSDNCTGEGPWAFPAGTSLPPGGYLVIAKSSGPPFGAVEPDGFSTRFGSPPDFECVDYVGPGSDQDDPSVPNMLLLDNNTSVDDQIRMIPGDGVGGACGAPDAYDAVLLYDGVPQFGGTLVDAIEWRDAACSSDACAGLGTGDDDAFPALPPVEVSLGRDAASTDTDDSSTDLLLGSPTPGAPNVPNAPPDVSNLAVVPVDPPAGSSPSVSAQVSDPDGIASVVALFSVDGGPTDSVALSPGGGDLYTADLPAQTGSSEMELHVRALDGGNGMGVGMNLYPPFSPVRVRWGTTPIFDIQFHIPPSDTGSSYEFGRAVNVEGVVTAGTGEYASGAFVIQSGTGLWSGVHCLDRSGVTQVERGDSVRVIGVVIENFAHPVWCQQEGNCTLDCNVAVDHVTMVAFDDPSRMTILSTAAAVPSSFVVPAFWLTTGAPWGEALEGVLCRVENVVVSAVLDFGRFRIQDASGEAIVGGDGGTTYTPTVGDSLVFIEGIVSFFHDERVLEPRDNSDVFGPWAVDAPRAVAPDAALSLGPAQPNPLLDGATSIPFRTGKPGRVRLCIHDVTGSRVRILLDGDVEAGPHHVIWDGRGENARPLPGGVYFYRLNSPEGHVTRKLVRLR